MFNAKFKWKGYDKTFHTSMLSSSIIFGMMVGALLGGIIMKIGRRRSLFVCVAIGSIGCLITIGIKNFTMLIIGRVLYGISTGLMTSITPKFIYELIPSHI
jgi:MFS family permease